MVIGAVALSVRVAPFARPQYTANSQTITIGGVHSNWVGTCYVGNGFAFDTLAIQNAGVLSGVGSGYIGNNSGDTNNTAAVSGTGSVWSNTASLYAGANALI